MYARIIHYLCYHILISLMFVMLPTKNGIFKSFTQKSTVSRQAYNVMKHAIIAIALIYSLIELLRPEIVRYIGNISLVTITSSLIIVIVIFVYYSRKWVKQDLERKILREESIELQETLKKIESISKIVIVNGDVNNIKWTEELNYILETQLSGNLNGYDVIRSFVTPKDQKKIMNKYKKVSANCKPGDTINLDTIVEIVTGKGNTKYIRFYSSNYVETDFENRKINGFLQDITKDIEIKQDLEDSIVNQIILLKEVHHRVKNNLQIILSLINLELKFNHEDYENILKKTRNRILSMASIHEQVYNSSDITHVNSDEYLKLTLENLFNLYSFNIKLHLDIISHELHMDKAIPLGLIINELGLNSIKYAFDDDEKGNFYVKYREENNLCKLTIWDDGRGLPKDFDVEKSRSLGFTIIRNLTKQIDGELEILDLPEGFGVKINFRNDL